MPASHSHPDKSGIRFCSHNPDRKERDADGHDHSAGITKTRIWLVSLSGAAIGAGFLVQWTLASIPWLATLLFAAGTFAGGALGAERLKNGLVISEGSQTSVMFCDF